MLAHASRTYSRPTGAQPNADCLLCAAPSNHCAASASAVLSLACTCLTRTTGMRRNRTAASASVDDLMRTICAIDAGNIKDAQQLTPNSSPTVSGTVFLSAVSELCHTLESGSYTQYWAELHDDMLTLIPSGSVKKAVPTVPKQVAFCTDVKPPPASVCTSPELRVRAEHILDKKHLSVYMPDGQCFWLMCESSPQEFSRWQHALKACCEARDGNALSSSRQAAYDRLVPLIWNQLLNESERYRQVTDALFSMSDVLGDENDIRKEEQINGNLRVHVSDLGAEPLADRQYWQDKFCAISGNLFLMYKNSKTNSPDELVCLQFATISANHDSSHAFNITTPMRTIELRANDDKEMDEWTDFIFALQCSESFSRLVPKGLRKQHFLSRVRAKGGELALRMLRRSAGRSPGDQSYPLLDDSRQQGADGLELSSMLKDARLGSLFRAFAENNNAGEELKLYMKVNDLVGVDVDELESRQVDSLEQNDRRNLLRMSQNYLSAGGTGEGESLTMRAAYDEASRRLISELLPLFCETDKFKEWMRQQLREEHEELQFIATIQSPAGFAGFRVFVHGRREEKELAAMLRIDDLIVKSTFDSPHLQLAQRTIEEYFAPGMSVVMDADALVESVSSWSAQPGDDDLRRGALSSFHEVVTGSLRPNLLKMFAKFKASSEYKQVVYEMARGESATKTTLVHWMHLPQAFQRVRDWMSQMRAAENIDFVADVVKYKNLDDISLAKDNANRIEAKYLADTAIAQVCLPNDIMRQIQEGLRPRFPSQLIFDAAVQYTTTFMMQDLWPTFKESPEYEMAAPLVGQALGLADTSALALLSIRYSDCVVRRAIALTKRIITIGSSNCDIEVPEAGPQHTTVLRIDPVPKGDGCNVSMLWTAACRIRTTGLADSTSSITSSVMAERTRVAVFAEHTPRKIKFGETFMLGGLFEAMLLPFHEK